MELTISEEELVERVAEAIYRIEGGMGDEEYEKVVGEPRAIWKTDAPWDSNPDELKEHERDDFRAMARTAIAEVRKACK